MSFRPRVSAVTAMGVVAALVVSGCELAATSAPAATAAPTATAAVTSSPTEAPSPLATPSAGPSQQANWSGAALSTKPMATSDVAAIDATVADTFGAVPDLPGLWIGVWDPAKGFYSQAYGSAVVDGAKATPADHGRIGSVTKSFTTTAILQQVAAGNLALDSTIEDVLPDLAAKYPAIKDITVEQLAGMTSGIQDYANTGVTIKTVVDDPQHVFTPEELIEAGMSLPLSAPGTGGYSTTNTIILGEMLEKLTGKPVEQVVTDVAVSLGMADTALQAPDQSAMPAPASHGYVESLGAQAMPPGLTIPVGTDVTDWTLSWGQAGGGMYSTVADLGTWAASGLGTSLLPDDLAAKRFSFHDLPAEKISYGLGLEDYGNGWIGHSGQLIGWEAIVLNNPETGAAFVALVNETGSLIAGKAVAAAVWPELLSLLR